MNEKIKEKLIKLKDNIGINPSLAESSPGWKILNYFKTNMNEKEKSVSIDFETGNEEFEKIAKLRKVKMVRYQENPRKTGDQWPDQNRSVNIVQYLISK